MRYIVPAFYWTGLAVIKAAVFVLVRVEVVGKENMPLRGALIIAANHLGNADPPVLASRMPRRLVYMAKDEMFQWLVLGFLARLAGAFPVKRFEADIGALRMATKVLESGQVLAMFPEGTRGIGAKLGAAHPGTALLALRSEAPILPIAITGTEAVHFPKVIFDFLRLRRPRIRIVVGHPFFLPPVSHISAEEVSRCTDLIMGRIAALLPPSYRGEYAAAAEPSAERAP